MTQRENESSEDYVKRLFAMGDSAVINLKKISSDMKKEGIVGFCKDCGCNIYKDKKHECSK